MNQPVASNTTRQEEKENINHMSPPFFASKYKIANGSAR